MRPFTFMVILLLAPLLWAQSIRPSTAESQDLILLADSALLEDDLGAAILALEVALEEDPSSELLIRTKLQPLYLELELFEEAQANSTRIQTINALDSNSQNFQPQSHFNTSQRNDSKHDPELEESGLMWNWSLRTGIQGFHRNDESSQLRILSPAVEAGVGLIWEGNAWTLDQRIGLMVQKDYYSTQSNGSSSKSKATQYSPNFSSSLEFNQWSFGLDYSRIRDAYTNPNYKNITEQAKDAEELGLTALQAILLDSLDQIPQMLNDTSDWLSVGANYLINPDGSWKNSLRAEMSWTSNQSLDPRIEWSALRTIGKWRFIPAIEIHSSRDLFKTYTSQGQMYLGNRTTWIGRITDTSNWVPRQESLEFQSIELSPSFQFRFKSQKWSFDVKTTWNAGQVLTPETAYFDSNQELVSAQIAWVNGRAYTMTSNSEEQRIFELNEKTNTPAWLRQSIRPTLQWSPIQSITLSLSYQNSFDLWRRDYLWTPYGDNTWKNPTQSWSLWATWNSF